MAPLKILACGNVDGNFTKFFKRISSIQKKNGPFEMVICSGNFFKATQECRDNWRATKNAVKADVPVYILGPTSKDLEEFYTQETMKDGEELCENLVYLGHKGIFKTTSGLIIAYLSGTESSACPNCKFSKNDIEALIEQAKKDDDDFQGVDILLTMIWPKDITKDIQTEVKPVSQSALISSLATRLKPRYHFSCHSEKFFERKPYRNHQVLQEQQHHVTRFLAVAPFGNPTNEKFLYAFSITPMSRLPHEELIKQPDDATEFPYKSLLASSNGSLQDKEEQPKQFFFSENKRKSDFQNQGPRKVPKGVPSLSTACWFCLGSASVEKHLVVSVGEHCYVALAKGALNKDHVLICPVSHHNSIVVLPDDVRMEMEKYKDGLRKMYQKENKEMVTFERNFYTQHLQLQVVGVPSDVSEDLRDTFMDLASHSNMEVIEVSADKDLSEMVSITTPYFTAELPTGERLLHRVKGRMPLQFGREVLASPSLLNLPDKVDWKKCKLSKENEIAATKAFRQRYQPFDFNFK